jgi:hypothetical protein
MVAVQLRLLQERMPAADVRAPCPALLAGFLLRVVCNERLREELTVVHDAMVDALQVGG